MANSSDLKQEILEQLDHLPAELQRRVLVFAQSLSVSGSKGVPGRELQRFAGILSKDEAKVWMKAIETGCERVDLNEW
jgi:hypothetical protein